MRSGSVIVSTISVTTFIMMSPSTFRLLLSVTELVSSRGRFSAAMTRNNEGIVMYRSHVCLDIVRCRYMKLKHRLFKGLLLSHRDAKKQEKYFSFSNFFLKVRVEIA